MPSSRKIVFLNYSNSADDIIMHRNFRLHLSVFKDKIGSWSKDDIDGGINKKEAIDDNLKKADAVIHLLSIHFENEEQCVELLKNSVKDKKKNYPILISSFDWESDDTLINLRDELLPKDGKPLDTHSNFNATFAEMVKIIRTEILGEKESAVKVNGRSFYYILSGFILLIGGITSYYVYDQLNNISLTLIVFLMFCCIILFVLRKIVFPTNISALK